MGGMRGGRHGDWRSSKQSREKKKERKIIEKSVMSIVTEELTCTHILKEIMQIGPQRGESGKGNRYSEKLSSHLFLKFYNTFNSKCKQIHIGKVMLLSSTEVMFHKTKQNKNQYKIKTSPLKSDFPVWFL